MMKCTATVQANLDYDDEPTAAEKIRMAFGVTSIVTALYAASPLSEGRPNGYRSFRAAVWLEMDEDRCGLLPFAFHEEFGFRHYAEWALDIPMFFVVRDGVYHRVGGMPFRRFMQEGWNGHRATLDDWEIHLSTLVPGGPAEAAHRGARRRRRPPPHGVRPAGAVAGFAGRPTGLRGGVGDGEDRHHERARGVASLGAARGPAGAFGR